MGLSGTWDGPWDVGNMLSFLGLDWVTEKGVFSALLDIGPCMRSPQGVFDIELFGSTRVGSNCSLCMTRKKIESMKN